MLSKAVAWPVLLSAARIFVRDPPQGLEGMSAEPYLRQTICIDKRSLVTYRLVVVGADGVVSLSALR